MGNRLHHTRKALVAVMALVFPFAVACAQAGGARPVGDAPNASDAASGNRAALAASHSAAFDHADRRARTVIQQIRCAQRVARLRQQGLFGPADSLGRRGQCTTVDGGQIGIFFDADTLFGTAARLVAVDLGTSTRRFAPLDTAAVLAVARAARTAQLRGMADYQRVERQFAPVAFRFGGDSIEVWLLPAAILSPPPLTVGGERGYVFSPDGRTVAREIDQFDALRAIALPDTGMVRIASNELVVPTLSELLIANLLHERGRQVAIDTQRMTSSLVGDRERGAWVHVLRER